MIEPKGSHKGTKAQRETVFSVQFSALNGKLNTENFRLPFFAPLRLCVRSLFEDYWAESLYLSFRHAVAAIQAVETVKVEGVCHHG